MTESEQFRQTVIEALKAGDGTPALVYADYLEEQGEDFPEFFRLLGRKVMEYPDWITRTVTPAELGMGKWSHSTSAASYINRTLNTVLLQFGRTVDVGDCWLGLAPYASSGVSRSLELHDYLYYGQRMARFQGRVWEVYGLPTHLYGVRVWVFDQGVIPDDWAVLINEKAKVLGVIRECV
jgi:uncharacterized protein (TIGR02996 family)